MMDQFIQDAEGVYFCQIDTHLATKDYLKNGRCVRLLAVEHHEFSEQALAAGVKTFTIDIDYWKFCTLVLSLESWRNVSARQRAEIDGRDDNPEIMSKWYRLVVNFRERDAGYLYETFSEEAPRYFGIQTFELMEFSLPVPPTPRKGGSLSRSGVTLSSRLPGVKRNLVSRNPFFFEAFHVGQGMCSLVHDKHSGVLLDAGAGKPVTRKAYLAGALRNDLRTSVSSLSLIHAVISHADSDHWRMLSWDASLRQKIDKIFVPVGARSLAFRDKAVIKKIVGIASQRWILDSNSTLHLLRSAPPPQCMDSNGDCLVALFARGHEHVLAAGDYVYERFIYDANRRIAALRTMTLSGVIVPHHGDAASAKAVMAARPRAKAFFSAGTHQGYGHPTPASLTEHKAKNYFVVSDPTQVDIVRVRLL